VKKTSTGLNENKGLKKMPVFSDGHITVEELNKLVSASNDLFSQVITGQIFKNKVPPSGGQAPSKVYRTVNNKDDSKTTGSVEVKAIDTSSADTGPSLFKNKFYGYPTTEGDWVMDIEIEDGQNPDAVVMIGRNAETPLKSLPPNQPATNTWNRSIDGTAVAIDDEGVILTLVVDVTRAVIIGIQYYQILSRDFSFDKHGVLFFISATTTTNVQAVV